MVIVVVKRGDVEGFGVRDSVMALTFFLYMGPFLGGLVESDSPGELTCS